MRMKRSVVVLAALCAAALLPAMSSRGGTAADPQVLRGSINQTNRSWVCHGPVDLDSVTVTIGSDFQGPLRGPGNDDAVHLSSGCTGRIGELRVVQYHGDGVKIGGGAHDLYIGGGYIRCFARDPVKHQDGIQAMGGQRVTFYGVAIACLTANNGSFFVNQGTSSSELPTDIVCDHCTLQGGGFTVRITHSLRSGIRNSRVVPGKFGGVRIDHVLAQDPVDANNQIITSDAIHTGPPKVLRVNPKQPIHVGLVGGVVVVSARVAVDEPVTLKVKAITQVTQKALPLLKASSVSVAVTGYQKSAIVYPIDSAGAFGVSLRLPGRLVVPRRAYLITVEATDLAGQTATLRIPFHR
jgi:hypothetical protein